MEFLAYLTEGNVVGFLLLLLRFSGVMFFFPFFENQLISMSVRGALILFMTILFFPLVPSYEVPTEIMAFIVAGLSEIMLGFLASVMLQIVFGMISFGGEVTSFAMGLTMASAFDPVTGAQKPIIGQLITLVALLVVLALDLHHPFFLFIAESLRHVPLGSFGLAPNILEYTLKAFANLFLIGFTMAFPIVALILLSDIIFGMIGKAHPQFNLLVIGFPVKIALAITVLIVILPAILLHFKREFSLVLEALRLLFF
ncbi:MAG: flagellar biosynthetic protein FliR [Wolinella sp.]